MTETPARPTGILRITVNDDAGDAVEGAVFVVPDGNTDTESAYRWATNPQGVGEIELPYGNYPLSQIVVPEGYTYAMDLPEVVIDRELVEIVLVNARVAADVTEEVTEPPATEAPVTEEPKTETPQTEASATEKTKAEKPKTEKPKTEAAKARPKSDNPKTGDPGVLLPLLLAGAGVGGITLLERKRK